MRDDKTSIAAPDQPPAPTNLIARLNEKAKVLNDVKVNVLTVVIFIACLGVITAVATSIAYVTHKGVQGMEHRN
jgi:hypothetical protein